LAAATPEDYDEKYPEDSGRCRYACRGWRCQHCTRQRHDDETSHDDAQEVSHDAPQDVHGQDEAAHDEAPHDEEILTDEIRWRRASLPPEALSPQAFLAGFFVGE
jgi:hypothetical protein